MVQKPTPSGAAPTAPLDRVISYAMGEGTSEERLEIERALSSGDPEVTTALNEVSNVLAEIPSALEPIVPPASSKERLLAEVRNGTRILPHTVAPTDASNFQPQRAISKLEAASPMRTHRKFGLAVLILLLLVSTITVSGISTEIFDPTHAEIEHKVAELTAPKAPAVATTHASVESKAEVTPGTTEQVAPENNSRPNAEIEPLDLEIGLGYIDLNKAELPGTPIKYPKAILPGKYNLNTQTNFKTFEAHARLSNDPEAFRYVMHPASEYAVGEGHVIWSTITGSVVFQVSGLRPTRENGNYVLYYIYPDGEAERMVAFQVASSVNMSFLPPRIPSRTVARVVLTYEELVDGESTVERSEVLFADQKEKIIVAEPLAKNSGR